MKGIDTIAVDNLRAEQAAREARQKRVVAQIHSARCDCWSTGGDVCHACLHLRKRVRDAFTEGRYANEPEITDGIRAAAQESFEKIGATDVFLVLWNKSMVQEVIPLIQMGLAVYLDKPIAVLVRRGESVPENVRRMARHVEEYDEKPTLAQVQRIMAAVRPQ